MIIKQPFETLMKNGGRFIQNEIKLDELAKESDKLCKDWENYYCNNENGVNFKITDDMKFIYKTTDGMDRKADITEFAFTQLCARIGVPASYIKKCFDEGKTKLAITNFKEWTTECNKTFLVREHDGVVRAILSDSYKMFDCNKVVKSLQNTVDVEKYKANEVFLSEDKLMVRFINRTPMQIKNEKSPIYSGFTVSSSDVGRGALAMHYFIYRQICQNGMIVTEKNGTLFKQAHIGANMTDGKIALFHKAFMDIDYLDKYAIENIRKNQETMLKDYELNMYIEKIKRELKLSKKGQENLEDLIQHTYGQTRWGVLNSITELAQKYTLDTRVEFEAFAGNTMMRVA